MSATIESNYTTCTATASEPLTVDHLKEVIAAIANMPPEPFGEYMRKRGFSPEDGYRLVLPETLRERCGPLVPRYVGFTDAVEAPFIYMDPTQWLKTIP